MVRSCMETTIRCSVCAHRQSMRPTELAVGRAVRTWQGWGWRVGQDRGHFPALEDKAGPLTDRKGHSLQVEGLACSQACSTACPEGSRELEALRWRSDTSGLCFRELTLAAVWRRSWIWERLKAGSPVRRLVP